jgi:uncharacterized RDD family membrane protein YckC
MTEETTAGREPGWYRDPAPANPAAPDSVRYWDGRSWTAQTRVASKRERREWMAEAAAAGRAYEQQLFERAQAGDVEAQLQLQAAAAATSRWTTPDGAVLAGWWVRVAAHLLDGVAVMILGTLFAWRFLKQIAEVYSQFVDDVVRAAQAGSPQPDATTLASATAGPILWVGITFLLVGFVYEVGFLKGYQATPGKMLLGLEVRLRERPGPLSWRAVLLRWGGKNGVGVLQFIPFVGGLVYSIYILLDYLWPLWDPHRQAIHDKLPGTNVVRRG